MPQLTPTAYFPPAHWFTGALESEGWQIERHESYQRRGFRNRALIAGPNKLMTLTVPLTKGKNQRMPITEVRINDDTDWRREHRQSISTAYGRAPYYDYYAEAVLSAIDSRHGCLYDLNRAVITKVIALLRLPILVGETDKFQGPISQVINSELAPYPQVFTDRFGFRGGLSILDALFCLGPAFVTQPTTHPDDSPSDG